MKNSEPNVAFADFGKLTSLECFGWRLANKRLSSKQAATVEDLAKIDRLIRESARLNTDLERMRERTISNLETVKAQLIYTQEIF